MKLKRPFRGLAAKYPVPFEETSKARGYLARVAEHMVGLVSATSTAVKLAHLFEQVVPVRQDLDFTNNIAEQAVRMLKVKQKISGYFRTSKGADCT